MTTENHIADGLLSRNEDEITDQELESERENDAKIANDRYCEDVAHICHLTTELIVHHGFSLNFNIFTWGGVTVYVHIKDEAFIFFDFDKGDNVKEKAKMLTENYLNSFIKSKTAS